MTTAELPVYLSVAGKVNFEASARFKNSDINDRERNRKRTVTIAVEPRSSNRKKKNVILVRITLVKRGSTVRLAIQAM